MVPTEEASPNQESRRLESAPSFDNLQLIRFPQQQQAEADRSQNIQMITPTAAIQTREREADRVKTRSEQEFSPGGDEGSDRQRRPISDIPIIKNNTTQHRT
jgi:hypothetical protein